MVETYGMLPTTSHSITGGMMAGTQFICTACQATMPGNMDTLRCPCCMDPIDILQTSTNKNSKPRIAVDADWINSVTLGEGSTPTVRLNRVAESIGVTSLYAKLEYFNPTGSFKDRGSVVVIAAAKAAGFSEVVEDSSGNAGASISAYAARAGMKAHIFVPSAAPEAKIRQIQAYGAQLHPIEGTREHVTDAAISFQRSKRLAYASHVLSPYFIEGTKCFAYEIFHDDLNPFPDHIVIPVGNGSLLVGAWKGFTELSKGGQIKSGPKIHAVQAKGIMPVVSEFLGKQEEIHGKSVAGGIAVGSPARKLQIVQALRATNGTAVAVSDDDIMAWRDSLSREEGIFAEPTSSAVLAGVKKLVSQGTIKRDEVVSIPITGFGLKDPV